MGSEMCIRDRIISIFISVLVTAAITRNEINDDFLKYFDKDITFRADTDWISQNLTGLNQIQFDMQSKKPNGISDPVFLNKLETFANWARNHEVVTNVQSITDVFKRLNRDLNGGDLEFYKIPENRELSAQYLLLYELSLPFGLDLNNQIDIDTFFAPNHTYDENTFDALKEVGILKIIDGYGLLPYEFKNIRFVPQLFYKLIILPCGIQSTQIHVNLSLIHI